MANVNIFSISIIKHSHKKPLLTMVNNRNIRLSQLKVNYYSRLSSRKVYEKEDSTDDDRKGKFSVESQDL